MNFMLLQGGFGLNARGSIPFCEECSLNVAYGRKGFPMRANWYGHTDEIVWGSR